MAALVEQKEAARLLGIDEEELKAMISRNEIFGYRDGPNWKFKLQELERVAEERGVQLGAEAPEPGGSGIDADLDMMHEVDVEADEGESILVSEEELGQSGIGAASTIIGKEASTGEASEDSDVQLATPAPAGGGDDILAADSGDDLLDVSPGSDVGSGLDLDLNLGSAGSSGSGALDASDALSLDDDLLASASDSLSLDDDASDALSADDDYDDESPTQLASTPRGGPSGLAGDSDEDVLLAGGIMAGDSGISASDTGALALGEDDDEGVLGGGSGRGSDITLGSGDSGIGLANPTDSGLSLEDEPLELGGSQVGSMSLGEDDMIELEEDADADAATQLKADDDFLLTPVDDDVDEESDSGSQVIALDTEQFDESADTMLAANAAILEEDDFGAPAGGMAMGAGAPMGGGMGQPMMMMPATQLPEANYSIWNVLSLMLVLALMSVTGMMMVDLIRNMWQWDESMEANRPLMEYVLSLLGDK